MSSLKSSDGKVVALPPRPHARSQGRDPRIDFFRGMALVMILVNHMPGNPWEVATIRSLGFSDAAEAFFVMSGIAAGIAYSPAVGRWLSGAGSLRDAVSPMWSRAWTLYLVQLLLTVIALGLFAWAAAAFLEPKFMEIHNLGLMYKQTGAALLGIPTLGYQIGYVNILPTYIVLMLVAPAILAAGIRWPGRTLAVAALLWGVAGAYRLNIPNHPGGGGWFLSPTSWQLIFVVGLLVGVRHRQAERLVPVNRPLFWTAVGFLGLVLAWRYIPDFGAFMNHKMAQLGKLGAPYNFVSHNKTYLALPRLLHILALLYVLSCLPVVTRIAAHRFAAPIRLIGQQGLLVFALGTVLALSGQIAMRGFPEETWLPWVLPPLAALISYGAAWGWSRLKAPRAGSSPRPAMPELAPLPAAGRDLA